MDCHNDITINYANIIGARYPIIIMIIVITVILLCGRLSRRRESRQNFIVLIALLHTGQADAVSPTVIIFPHSLRRVENE